MIAALFLFCGGCAKKEDTEEAQIKNLMLKQQECWNAADIPCFMEYYWKDDSLRFIGSKGIKYGWQTTFDGYINAYPDKATMGTLTFEFIDIRVFTGSSAYVLGEWKLAREEKRDVGGYFSLIWKKIEGRWVIVSDHTS